MSAAAHSAVIARERSHLVGVAYRMLGSRGEAEDVVQEALTRLPSDLALDSPRAFLTTVVTRLCLDELKSARRRRETYVGPWLPEPWLDAPSPEEHESQRAEASLALLLVLEQLSPKERVVFVLRELVDCEFAEIASTLGVSEQACRKLLSRAREKVQARSESPADKPAEQQLAARFFAAAAMGDVAQLVAMLTPEATLTSDHGGKASAARNVLVGARDVARFLAGVSKKALDSPGYRIEPRFGHGTVTVAVFAPSGACEALMALDVVASADGARVARVFAYRNPDKLERVR
jgi:RNA polymerase sigma-70 factor (ECF subfamily)